MPAGIVNNNLHGVAHSALAAAGFAGLFNNLARAAADIAGMNTLHRAQHSYFAELESGPVPLQRVQVFLLVPGFCLRCRRMWRIFLRVCTKFPFCSRMPPPQTLLSKSSANPHPASAHQHAHSCFFRRKSRRRTLNSKYRQIL